MSKYIYDDDGLIIKIENEDILNSIGEEEYEKWQKYNEDRVRDGYSPLEYEEYQRDINNCRKIITKERELKTIKKEKEREFKRSQDNLHKFIYENLGLFYFSIYNSLLKVDLEPQYKFRFVYLCTYMNYDGKLEYGRAKRDNKLMLERDLMEVLKLKEEETRKTKKALLKANLITIEEDKTISVNKKYAFKGKIDKRNVKRGVVRIMEEGIRELYLNAKAREHKNLELLIELLPYVNYHYNVLCHNPNEKDAKKLQIISPYELSKTYHTNVTRMRKNLFDIEINGEHPIGIFAKFSSQSIFINPKIYFKGNDIDKLSWLVRLFEMGEDF